MEEKITTNAKDDYTVIEMEKDPFFDCRWGYIDGIPEHHIYQNMCRLKSCIANCKNCSDFSKKPKFVIPTVSYKLTISWFDEDFSDSGDDGSFDKTFYSEVEARDFLAEYIKNHKNLEIWWTITKCDKLAEGHLERQDKNI